MHTRSGFRSFSQPRLRTSSYKEAVVSITRPHTEAINIWSHLLGSIWFCYSAVHFISTCTSPLTQDAVVVLVYLVAVALCFACSTLYHLFADHVRESSWLQIDHFGIVCAIWASSISFILFSFDCRQGERQAYVALITLAALLCISRLSKIRPQGLASRGSRIGAHVILGGIAALPGLRRWHLHTSGRHAGLLTEFSSLIILNSIGGGIYATRLLDKATGMELGLPDVSHHIMHVMVVAGAWIYERGLLSAYRTRAAEVPGTCL